MCSHARYRLYYRTSPPGASDQKQTRSHAAAPSAPAAPSGAQEDVPRERESLVAPEPEYVHKASTQPRVQLLKQVHGEPEEPGGHGEPGKPEEPGGPKEPGGPEKPGDISLHAGQPITPIELPESDLAPDAIERPARTPGKLPSSITSFRFISSLPAMFIFGQLPVPNFSGFRFDLLICFLIYSIAAMG